MTNIKSVVVECKECGKSSVNSYTETCLKVSITVRTISHQSQILSYCKDADLEGCIMSAQKKQLLEGGNLCHCSR